MPVRRWILFLAVVAFGGGCARPPERGEVEGVVKLNGTPLAGVQVAFAPTTEGGTDNLRSTGVTDSAGKYRLKGTQGEPGAPVGTHTVVVVDVTCDQARLTEFLWHIRSANCTGQTA